MQNNDSKFKITIVYLTWNDEPQKYLTRALEAIGQQTYARENLRLVIVYNSHKEKESSQLSFVKTEIKKLENILPETVVLAPDKNLGFSGGNNLGMQWAIDSGCDYVFLHNADGYLAPGALAELVKALTIDANIGQAQALVRLYPQTDLINSAGNSVNYLGIGFCNYFKKPVASLNLPAISDIGYASGSATMIRTDLLKQLGKWNEDFYLYHEDLEYSWRLKINGYRVVLAKEAEFFHEYKFDKNLKKFYWLERNRHAFQYLFYRWPTLILTWPLEIGYNLVLLVVAGAGGWLPELLRVYGYWLNPSNWQKWRVGRCLNQQTRKLNDRQLLAQSTATVESAELVVSGPIKFCANLVFKIYYYILKLIIWW
ncbi:MAG: hypothetical protein A2538_04815 [Candidatus Magasanikbacteria bacterium RIFOXYD2_FULL_41_14]|uniref:Glycosyltransferase 2-like domain-containing protein n=1 Tax=Candidatus Magasanikbacteria bacterium RIFOXYD2_FULL_41_14 TaxID=1798709 RepID=A0A1F6PFN6_9BACT|nr:MAG: hypothetical protein A2538_04815 [Candidatus Magasanikbacteria bacterium RIFOXYD2_FULL_41_14]